ncbi:MAG: ABC transporter ATP-binding protein [Pseudoflavonifractor sp.]|nr:ABC transporter ATP-binding protein [Pseudoflavonifractor sp.]
MNETVVSVKGFVKKYGSLTAVDGIDLDVLRGEVFGLLGANGAGKTTTFECLEGLRKSDGGNLRVAGCNPQTETRALRRKLGVQLQSSSLPGSIRVDEAITLVSAWQDATVSAELIGKLGVKELLRKQYRQLSTGQKRRVHLVLALCGHPEVVILDEPTAGLDVENRAQLHDVIRGIKTQGVTVLLATHDMAEAETLCDRIAILVRGRIAVCGTPEQITAAGSLQTRVRLRTARGSLLPGADTSLAAFKGAKDGYLEWNCQSTADAVIEILGQVREAGDTVEDLRVERPSLEERFLELVREGEIK